MNLKGSIINMNISLELAITIGGTALVGVPTHLTFYKYTNLCFQPPKLSMKNVTSQLKPPLVGSCSTC